MDVEVQWVYQDLMVFLEIVIQKIKKITEQDVALLFHQNIQNKLKSFAHAEFNKEFYTNIETIKKAIYTQKDLFGRNQEIQNLLKLILNGENIFLSGLPGIGKTSLARGVVTEVLNHGWTVRWATCYSNSDISDIARQWIGQNPPRDNSALISRLAKNKNLLVIDENIASRAIIP